MRWISERPSMRALPWVVIVGVLLASPRGNVSACTTAVISGRVTADGRPILWKNRDYASAPHNEVAVFEGGQYRAVAVVNAGSRGSVWMGVNEAGFCIENSLSTDLRSGEKSSGLGNGQLMKAALQSCATVEDFERLLSETNQDGRRTVANFGVIDARGGAALFETGPRTFQKFDANDPQVAPRGYIVRSNFATTARDLPAEPTAEQLSEIASSGRYLRACSLIEQQLAPQDSAPEAPRPRIQLQYVLGNMTRDLTDAAGRPLVGSINGAPGALPTTIDTDSTISRTSTVSAAVFHGVRPGEDPAWTTMWTVLGDPKFSVAVPCWPTLASIAGPLSGGRGGELGELARLLRDVQLTFDRQGIRGRGMRGIWQDLLPLERAFVSRVARDKDSPINDQPVRVLQTALHQWCAREAHAALHAEMLQAKSAALRGEYAQALDAEDDITRVAIYDHSDGSARSPGNLMRILTDEAGYCCRRVSPADIRRGSLANFDLLIMPGGSGSAQSKRLEDSGRQAIRDFVADGGGYVGICAGSYLASTHYEWSLGILNARVWDRAHWARGTGDVELQLSETGQRLFDCESGRATVYYGQGPLLFPGDNALLPEYEVLASYASEVAKKGAPADAMVGTHAIVRAEYGRGRVICYSPHPEKAAGPHPFIEAGVRWAAESAAAVNR